MGTLKKGAVMKLFGICSAYVIFLLMPVGPAGCDRFEKASVMHKSENTGAAPSNRSDQNRPAVETAYFAAGCFWGVEAAFAGVEGVISTTVGYMGGHTPDPTYQQVCTNTTGHAETVRVDFDPATVSYSRLLDIFWSIHDPTSLNRQGPDVGTQYRSAIFVTDQEQHAAAIESRNRLNESHKFDRPVVTEIEQAKQFYKAEEYHQQYLKKQGKTSCGLEQPDDRELPGH